MQQSLHETAKILDWALGQLGRAYSIEFDCVAFARGALGAAGISLPVLMPYAPPRQFNISTEELYNPPAGQLVFFLRKDEPRPGRSWSHVAISLGGGNLIHCSLFCGRKVVISRIEELLVDYNFAPST